MNSALLFRPCPFAEKAAAEAARAARARVLLIGCGKTKADTSAGPVPAAELYTGNLFKARRAYAEATGLPWWIVSAEHGLVAPTAPLRAYDTRISDLGRMERSRWGLETLDALWLALGSPDPREVVLELHAGRDYFTALRSNQKPGEPPEVELPLEGLGIGHQLSWYMDNTPTHAR